MIEVGVDNASPVVEHASVYGLANTPDCAGRVGQGADGDLRAAVSTNDGGVGETARRLRAMAEPTIASDRASATWKFMTPASFWARASRTMHCMGPTWPAGTIWNGRARTGATRCWTSIGLAASLRGAGWVEKSPGAAP